MSETAQLISDSINRIFADSVDHQLIERLRANEWPAELWQLIETNGFSRVLDGQGDGAAPDWNDAQAILYALGYHRAPLPLAETLVANWLCARAGLDIDDGPATLVQGRDMSLKAGPGDSAILSGRANRVPWARHCDRLVIAAWVDGCEVIGVVRKDTQHCAIEHDHNIAHEPRDNLSFSACPVRIAPLAPPSFAGSTGSSSPDSDQQHSVVRLYGALARATAMAGAAHSVLDQSVLYANDRIQFGKPLAKFQAIQHMLAELGSEVAAGTMAVTAACAAAGSARAPLEIAVAKVRTGMMAATVARIAHQVHGAIGFTREHSLHHGTQRLWSWRGEFGNDTAWARIIGKRALAVGGEGFWAEIMAR